MKKSQAGSEVFIFLLGILIAAAILIYGYSAISSFLGDTERISLLKFSNNLEAEVRTISTQFGDVRRVQFDLPSTYSKICFLDLEYPEKFSSDICNPATQDYNPIICDAWTTPGINQNVFFEPMAESTIPSLPLRIEEGYLCVTPVQGRIILRFEGRGDSVKISRWN